MDCRRRGVVNCIDPNQMPGPTAILITARPFSTEER